MAITFVSVLAHLILPLLVHGQELENVRFSHLTDKDGLTHHEALFVFQDTQGFMWFGTKNGLNKYDGIRITPFFHEPGSACSLGGNFVHWIQEDKAGNLWIATWGDGISKYDPRTGLFTNYFNDESDPKSLGSDNVWSLRVDSGGLVWAATDNGLSKLDPATGSCDNFRHDPKNPNSLSHNVVSRIQEDNQGMLWISTYGGGLNHFDPNSETFTRYQHHPDDPGSLSNDNLWGVYVDSHSRIWIASEDGLIRFDPETETFTGYRHDENDPGSLSSNTVTYIYEDRQGMLWLGTFGGGLNRFDPARETFRHHGNDTQDPYSLGNDIIMGITEDMAGTLWLATYAGIDKWDPGENQFKHYRNDPGNPHDLSDSKVRSIYEDASGSLWLGTDGGLNLFDLTTNRSVYYLHDDNDPTSISGNDIWAIDQDKRGHLWLGTHGAGLNRFDPEQGVSVRYSHDPQNPNTLADNALYDLVVDHDRDVLWIAAYQSGLDKFDILEQTFTHYGYDARVSDGIVSNWTTVVFVDSKGSVWVGTENGLSRFDVETEVFTNYKQSRDDPNSLSSNMIQAIYEDSRGVVWIGTANGLNRFDEATQRFEHYHQDEGLPGNRIGAISEDDEGLLWISTNMGLSRFNHQEVTFRNYSHRDGLQGDLFFMHSVCKTRASNLLFGGMNGFNVIRPGELVDNPQVPQVVLTEFRIFGQPVQVGEGFPLDQHISHARHIELNHDQSVFSIDFAALNYTNSRNNEYAYMLDGFDTGFRYTTSDNRSASYMNLDPGDYTFRVMASNNDGVWNEEGASLDIIVHAPWSKTWAFKAFLVVLASLIGLVVVLYMRRLAREVTRRRQNEKELKRSRERFKSLFEQAGDYIIVLGVAEQGSLVIVDANQAACKVHGYTHEELLRMPISDLDRRLEKEQIGSFLDRVNSGENVLFETIHERKDGTTFPVEVSAKLLRTETDQDLVVSIERDISERKEAEDRIKQQQYYLMRAQELGRIGTWELDLENNILLWTDETCRIFDVPPGSVVDYEFFISRIHPDDREYVNREWKASVAGKPYDIEHRVLIDGETTWVREKAELEFNEDGEVIKAIGVVQDITDRKQADAERGRLQDQLTQAQKMESIGRLAGGVAHDFNNMLSVILGHTELAMVDLPEDSPLQDGLQEILKSARRSADLTNQLLAYARKQTVAPKALDLNQTIDNMLQMLERLIGEDIDLVWKPEKDLELVNMDPGQVDQILANLCVNARDAIGHDPGQIIIETGSVFFDDAHCLTHTFLEPGYYVKLSVSDDGCGMSEEVQDHIFEPFYTTKGVGEGTGLGLATVYGIVKQNSGFITVDSEVSERTTFCIYLPALRGTKFIELASIGASKPTVGGSETLLVVEDEPAILDLTRILLERLGYKVLSATTPGEAILRAEEYNGEIHLLITDVVMPKMNGRELARNLRTRCPELQFLFMSGYTADVIAHQGVLDEGVHFLQKPFKVQEMATKVREALS